MEIIKLLALLIGSAILLTCCSARPSPNLSYQEKAFRAHVYCQNDNMTFGAIFTSIPSAEDPTKRYVCLEFTSPESLCGIKVCERGGAVTVSLDGMEISAPHAVRWLSLAELFSIDATVKKSALTSIDGQKFNFIKAVSDDGKEFSLYLHPASGLPRRILGDINGALCTLDVISLEFIPN